MSDLRHTYSTASVPPAERLEFWRIVAKEVLFDLDFDATDADEHPFSASISSQSAGDVHIYEVNAGAHDVFRSNTQSVPEEAPRFMVILQGKGECEVEQIGRTGLLAPGDFALLDTRQKFELKFPGDMQQFIISLPQEAVETALMSPEQITGLTVSSADGAGRIASAFMASFISDAAQLESHTLQGMTWAMLEILNATAISVLSREKRHRTRYQAFQIQQIRLYIEDHLRDPELTPSGIAAAHGISKRYLSRLFENADSSVGRLILSRRLEKCRQDLLNPSLATKPVSQIAYSWGFNSPSHFSRRFKERFGISPQDARATPALKRSPPPSVPD